MTLARAAMTGRLVAALLAVGSAGLIPGPQASDALRRHSRAKRIEREAVAISQAAPELAEFGAPRASLVIAQTSSVTAADVADAARSLTEAKAEVSLGDGQKAALALALTLLGLAALFLVHPAPTLGTRQDAFTSTALVACAIAVAAAAHFLGGPAGVRLTISTILLVLVGVMNLLLGVPKFRYEWTPEGWRRNVGAHYYKLHQPWWAGILFVSCLLLFGVLCLLGSVGAFMPDSQLWRWIALCGAWGMATIYSAGTTCHTFYSGWESEGPMCAVIMVMSFVAAALRAPDKGGRLDEAFAYFAVSAFCAIVGGGWLFLVPRGPVPKCLQDS